MPSLREFREGASGAISAWPEKLCKIAVQVAQALSVESSKDGEEISGELASPHHLDRLMSGDDWLDGVALLSAAQQLPLEATSEYVELACGWERVLAQYDRKMRRGHGAFFTPRPLAQFMVAAATQLMERHFPDEAREPRDLGVLDPTAGSGVFLLELLDQKPSWATSLRGIEWMLGSTCVARMLVRAKSADLAKSPPIVHCDDALSHRDCDFVFDGQSPSTLIVLGNPPYSNFRSVNESEWITELLRDYKNGLSERKHNLNDDFIKFIRWAQHQVDSVGQGIVAFVTNNTFVRGITHRLMRRSLMTTFDEVYVLDLGGEQFQRDKRHMDENVFGIRQGIAISFFVRRPDRSGQDCQVNFARWTGSRREKLDRLSSRLDEVRWTQVQPAEPNWMWSPSGHSPAANVEYRRWPSVIDLVQQYVSGVQTKKDSLFIDRDREALTKKIKEALAQPSSQPEWLAKRLVTANFDASLIRPCQVTAFDRRWMYFDPSLLGRSRGALMESVDRGGRGLVFMRQSTNPSRYDHFLTTDCVVTDRVFHSRHGAPFVAPWWLYENRSDSDANSQTEAKKRRANLQPHAWSFLNIDPSVPSEDVWHYIYGVVHQEAYRVRHEAELRIDFPRIPPADSRPHFQRIAELGRRLVSLHCWSDHIRDSVRGECTPTHVGKRCPKVAHADETTTRVVINETLTVGIPTAAWNWSVGGVPCLKRWLAQRQGTRLTVDEQHQWQMVMRAAAWHESPSHAEG